MIRQMIANRPLPHPVDLSAQERPAKSRKLVLLATASVLALGLMAAPVNMSLDNGLTAQVAMADDDDGDDDGGDDDDGDDRDDDRDDDDDNDRDDDDDDDDDRDDDDDDDDDSDRFADRDDDDDDWSSFFGLLDNDDDDDDDDGFSDDDDDNDGRVTGGSGWSGMR